MSRNLYPRETVEFQPVTVLVDDVAVTTGVEFCVAASGSRPVTWIAPVTLSSRIGVMVEDLTPGDWTVWARVTSSPELPVIDCGFFTVT